MNISEKRDHCVYVLIDPRDETVRKVGRTRFEPSRRLKQIIQTCGHRFNRVNEWLTDLISDGIEPRMIVVRDGLTQGEARVAEIAVSVALRLANAPIVNQEGELGNWFKDTQLRHFPSYNQTKLGS